jgi:hypothetical protein
LPHFLPQQTAFCSRWGDPDGVAAEFSSAYSSGEGLAVVPNNVVHPGLLEGWGCLSTQIKEDTG